MPVSSTKLMESNASQPLIGRRFRLAEYDEEGVLEGCMVCVEQGSVGLSINDDASLRICLEQERLC